MTPGAERDPLGPVPEDDGYVRQQLASIDGSLFNGMPSDGRYESGVPEGQRGNPLDFIQMTGLTRPPLRAVAHGVEGALAQTPIYDDLNPSLPLSFYEKGVADVDESLTHELLPGALRDAMLDSDLVPNRVGETLVSEPGPSRSAQAFRDIVAGLQRVDFEAEPEMEEDDARPDRQESDTPVLAASEEERSEEVSTSGALLALLDEFESAMGTTPDEEESAPGDLDAPVEAEQSTSKIEDAAPVLPGAPAAEIGDDDFDALLASLSGHKDEVPAPSAEPEPESKPEPAPPVVSEVPAAETGDDDFDAVLASLSGSPDEVSVETVSEPEPEPLVAEPEADPVSGISEDWDTLLDGMTVRGSEPILEPTPVPKAVASGALAEAEQLMQALEKRPQRPSPSPVPVAEAEVSTAEPTRMEGIVREALPLPAPISASLSGPVVPEGEDGDPQSGYDYNAAPSRRRSRRHSRVARRGLKLAKAVFFIALLAGLVATLWIYVASPMLLQDEDLAVRAERLMAARDYSAASQTYLQLASRIAPGDTERSNAEFRAAYALTLGPETSGDDTKRRYGTALALFKQFTEDYPQHPKRARALSLMGRLHFELQDFEQAIAVLRDQVKPADDPAAALSMLRYLARAYSMTGNYEQAETSYLQAATLPGNYNAEADYLELGDLFRQRAGLENDPVARKPLEDMAMSYWNRALQVPGVAPGDRNTLEERLQWLTFTEENAATSPGEASRVATPETPPEIPAASPAAPVAETAVAAPEDPASPTSPIPVAADEAGRAEVPGAELEALAPPAPQAVP